MLKQFGANYAAVHSAAARFHRRRFRILTGAAIIVAVTLGGCIPTTVPLVGPDPADPAVPVARVGYRSTTAPYTRLRPTLPTSWREQNQRVAPAPKSGQ